MLLYKVLRNMTPERWIAFGEISSLMNPKVLVSRLPKRFKIYCYKCSMFVLFLPFGWADFSFILYSFIFRGVVFFCNFYFVFLTSLWHGDINLLVKLVM